MLQIIQLGRLMADWNDVSGYEGRKSLGESLMIEAAGGGVVSAYFRPVPRAGAVGGAANRDQPDPVKIVEVDVNGGLLTVFPMKNLDIPSRDVEQKYRRVERIAFAGGTIVAGIHDGWEEGSGGLPGSYLGRTEAMPIDDDITVPELEGVAPQTAEDVVALLEGLPPYCVKDPCYGLGFRKQFRAIVSAIEQLTDAREIRVMHGGETHYDAKSRTFMIPDGEMREMVRGIQRVDKTTRVAANTVNGTRMFNRVAESLALPKQEMRYGRSLLRKTLTAVANEERPLSEVERSELLETLARNAPAMLEREPETIEGLESGIALARVTSLREKLGSMMKARLKEKAWQDFLQRNPFILSLVFGRPIVKIGDQASVGGRKIAGGGEKIADFLVRNSLTNNAALVEIKTPQAKLLNKTPYRGGVYAPAGELVGAINQVLDQKGKFEQEIAGIRNRNRQLVVEAHHVHACVLAGTMPKGADHIRCFELFRHNLKDVTVVTYDELVRKVADLCQFLEGPTDAGEQGAEIGT